MSRKKLFIQIASLLLTIVCAVWLLKIPSGNEHPFLFGFSFVRILFFACFLLAGVLQSVVFFFSKPETLLARAIASVENLLKRKIWLIVFSVVLLISWYFAFLPVAHFSSNQALFTRLKPVIIWVFGQSALGFYACLFDRGKNRLQKFKFGKQAILQGAFFLLFAVGIWLLIARTKFGLTPDVFWDNLGVPISLPQVVLALLCTLIVFLITKKYLPNRKHIEIYLFFLLWIIAAAVWISIPQNTSTFNPGPFLPNDEFYPNSDAQTYDTCALSSLLGQNYCHFDKNAVSKPFYIAFLFILHLFSGNDYTLLMNLQVIFIALLPPVLFLIGRQLHSNLLGFLAAIFSIIKITNSIADSLVIWTVSNPKFMMSEPFLAVFIALFCLFFILWFKDPQNNKKYLYVSAVILGLSTLIRHNVWILLPVFVLVVFIKSIGNGWKKIYKSVMFIFIMVAAITPWAYRNVSLNLTPIASLDSLKYVVFGNRYGLEVVEFGDGNNNENSTSIPIIQEEINSEDISKNSNVDQTESDSENLVVKEPDTKKESQDLQGQNLIISNSPIIQEINRILFSTGNHFLHNILSVFLVLPVNYRTSTVEDTITKTWEINPWTRTWDGTLELDAQILMALNILILCLGIISLYRKSKIAYCIPLIIMVAYLAGVAFAKTSGGRYIVPVDWMVLIFYAAGLLFIVEALGILGKINDDASLEIDSAEEIKGSSNKTATLLLAIFLGIGIFIPVSENIFPERHFPQTYAEFLNEVKQNGYEMDADYFSIVEVEKFLEEENAIFIAGQGFYPKLLDPADENATEFFPTYLHEPYTLLFTLLNEKMSMPVYLPISTNQISFPNGATVSILGCKEDSGQIQALSIMFLDGNVEIIHSQNLDNLTCKK